MTQAQHPLLLRQLRRALGLPRDGQAIMDADQAVDAVTFDRLLQLVSDSYAQFDRDLALRGRSLALSSEELTQANDRLREEAAGQQQLLQALRQGASALLPDVSSSGPVHDGQSTARQLEEALAQRLLAERRLAESEQQFRSLVANLPGCVYRRLHDAKPTMLFVSGPIFDAIGWPASDFVDTDLSLARQVHPDDRAMVMKEIDAAIAARRSFSIQYRYRHRDGTPRWANERGQGVFDADGKLLYLDGVLFDRTENELAQRALGDTRQQLLDAVEALDIGVLMFDRDNRLIICNRKYRQWHPALEHVLVPGAATDDVLRAIYRNGLDDPTQRQGEEAWMQRRLAQLAQLDNGPMEREVELDGRWFRMDDSRTPGGVTISLRTDVTAIKQSMRDLVNARDTAEAASRAKTRFLANMSHELRTPLNAVIGAAQLMQSGNHDAGQRAYLADAIERSGTNLLGLIDNILDLSRIEAGQLTLFNDDFDMLDCIDAALITGAVAARAKGLELACVVQADLDGWRHGDAARVRQVVLNLLGNAVKFTQRGEIVVRLERDPANPSEGLVISVSDTGIGIDAPSLAHVFEPFRQADEGANRRFGGSGLGLAIVYQLVQAMHGRVDVQSGAGQGSCFTVTLPLPHAHQAREIREPLGLHVAFVEPHDASAQALQQSLLRLGCMPQRIGNADQLRQWCAVRGAADGRSRLLICTDDPDAHALHALAAEVLDHQCLVGMSRAASMTADPAPTPWRASRDLTKPVVRASLRACLMDPPVAGDSDGQVQRAGSPLSGRRLHVLVVEDDALNQTLVCALLRHAGYRVSAANDGYSAIADVARQRHDVVLMDWQMPDLDGLEVTRRLRSGDAGAHGRTVPIIALTANAFAEDRDACLAAGMNDFLSKPVLAASLVAAIERQCQGTGRIGVASADALGWTSDDGGQRDLVFDPSVLAALPMVLDGSQPDYADEVMQQFVDSMPGRLSGIAAAHADGDLQKLQRGVHALKSSAFAVGAMALARQAENAENQLRAGGAPGQDLLRQMHHAFEELATELRRRGADTLSTGIAP